MANQVQKSKDSQEKVNFWIIIETAAKEIQSWPEWKRDSTWLNDNYTTSQSSAAIGKSSHTVIQATYSAGKSSHSINHTACVSGKSSYVTNQTSAANKSLRAR